ncbi:ADP-heptose:LPS heptosyltransferase [Sphingobacterium zeae]|uniref:ADP-heptose:LPS heptosyltransferase n=1 Tax=Sphingobacterium zeae TaxID=1776859 RepID=A0ABU0U3U4_9SPHI|nr:glycosyltransferase family 9 protein [Sphingobacterium zeae]MDQ1149618.1 ADP-heptose:LPS heptosyltransferase [Sphingobacterium zeae]
MDKWKDCKNMLIIRLDNMGDLIMNNAALQQIKANMPHCKITLLASEMAIPIIPFLGTVDAYIQYDAPWMKLSNQDSAARTEALVANIKEKQFDSCIIFNVYSQNPMAAILLAYLAGIPKRAAYMRENPYSLLTHWVPDKEPLFQVKHQITRDLELVKYLGISHLSSCLPTLKMPSGRLSIFLPKPDLKRVILNYDVSEEKRRIPIEVARELLEKLLGLNFQVVLVGKENNGYLRSCSSVDSSPKLVNLIGKTSVRDLLLVVQQADAVITVNTGVAHISCALQRPTLVLYAQTNPQHIPWSRDSDFILYPVSPSARSKNTINIFVDKQNRDSKIVPLTTAVILKKFQALLGRSGPKKELMEEDG